jgi:hypothetical protein
VEANIDVITRWVAALRSGEYKQGKGTLRPAENKYCCWGVLCDLHRQIVQPSLGRWERLSTVAHCFVYLGDYVMPSPIVLEWAGLNAIPLIPDNLMPMMPKGVVAKPLFDSLNDAGFDFLTIADIIEAMFFKKETLQ